VRKETKRLQFDFSEDELQRLRAIGVAIDAVTNVEIIRRALRFYGYAIKKGREGFSLEFFNGDTRISLPKDLF